MVEGRRLVGWLEGQRRTEGGGSLVAPPRLVRRVAAVEERASVSRHEEHRGVERAHRLGVPRGLAERDGRATTVPVETRAAIGPDLRLWPT